MAAGESSGTPADGRAVQVARFLERLRQVLEDRQMTRADLAREVGVGVATVTEWFTRGRIPGGDVLLRLPGALAVNGHWLLTGEGPREVVGAGAEDLYRRGARDALRTVGDRLADVARRFEGESGTAPPPRTRPPAPPP